MYIQSLSYFMLICTLVHVSGFSSSISRQSISNRKTYLKMNFPQKYITDIGKVCAIVALPLSLTFSDFGTLFDNSHVLTIKAANADVRAQQKRTYFRFVPKLKTGLTFYATELKEAVDNEDYKKISSIFDEFVYKQHKTDSELDQMETYVNLNFFRPMKVFAGTFAERGIVFEILIIISLKLSFHYHRYIAKNDCLIGARIYF